MGKEIERKFTVIDESYREIALSCHYIKQGYLLRSAERTVRVRIMDNNGFITIKGPTSGCIRAEFEYEIPLADAEELIKMSLPKIIEKNRYIVSFEGKEWEIDEFKGTHKGLILAEIELDDEFESFQVPPFIGDEVTGNLKYYNSTLSEE